MNRKEAAEKRKQRLRTRNKTLAARFYYWSEVKRVRFDDVVKILESSEFFVEYQTIRIAIDSQQSFLDELYSDSKAVATLKKHFPAWNWN